MTNWYVAKSGNDANDGTESNPWLTIKEAVDRLQASGTVPVAGDTINVSNGTYAERPFVIDVNGYRTGGNSLTTTIQNKSGQTDVTIDGQYTYPTGNSRNFPIGLDSDWGDLVRITGKYIVWDGIDVKRSKGGAIGIRDTAEQVIVKNCSVYDNLVSCFPIQGDSTNPANTDIRPNDITIDNCVVYEAGMFYTSMNRRPLIDGVRK